MSFFTAINCMDGRVQLPVIRFLTSRMHVDHIDMVTEPGPVRTLAEQTEFEVIQSIFRRVDVSVEKHRTEGIAVVAHHDCAGNPVAESVQREQLAEAVTYVRGLYPRLEVVGLWVDENWSVSEVEIS